MCILLLNCSFLANLGYFNPFRSLMKNADLKVSVTKMSNMMFPSKNMVIQKGIKIVKTFRTKIKKVGQTSIFIFCGHKLLFKILTMQGHLFLAVNETYLSNDWHYICQPNNYRVGKMHEKVIHV